MIHVVGAGLAGLAAAVELVAAGQAVTLHEAAPRAGGRCRSYDDAATGLTIDNGNHLVLSGNTAVAAYLARIGAGDRLSGPDAAAFTMHDLRDGTRFTVRPNDGGLPWWVMSPGRRVPGTRAADYLALRRLLRPPPGATVGDCVPTTGPLWDRLLEPVLIAALNTPAAGASAALAGAVVRETLAKGGRALRPRIAVPTLAAAFVDPALDWLRANGATLRFGARLATIEHDGDRVTALAFGDGRIPVDAVVVAVPAPVAAGLVPGLTVPTAFNPIVSLHFAHVPPPGAPAMLGLLGGTSEWIFAFPNRLSVTISAADAAAERDRADLAAEVWGEVAAALGLTAPLPPWQVVKERRATFAATVAQDALRPPTATRWRNLALAGDWTQTGLPATIEGALRSGTTAADLAHRALAV